ncbi:hypothetical protein BU15DRAFT_77793 [Melanogaster broomeanus]|nr:hypothetical protein BU15DRAFT_77793 [Melanogaster broomeanus]
MSRIASWVHYVPIQISYTDLYDAVAFFHAHDDLAAHIAAAGKEWSQHFWRKEDCISVPVVPGVRTRLQFRSGID